ncbi:MAG: glycosyltransferase family 4 protein [Candidatus Abyssubacteria bacterium]|nr:glycosyltransferase family 4 protein [Candidatus Abyssubacteria bacterium]
MTEKEISIGVFEPVAEMTGGKAYRKALCDALARKYDVEIFDVSGGRGLIPSVRLRRMKSIACISERKDVWIRDFSPVVGMSVRHNPGKNIALFHHLYTVGEETDMLDRVFEALFRRNVRRCDRVVAVSNFWRDYLCGLGLTDVRVIRNGLDPSRFVFDPKEVKAFREKHRFSDSPIIYIGNCRRDKGVVEVYEALKDQNYQLVTSGEPEVDLPCRNLNRPYDEYLLLLKASSAAVTMSRFREGWCRTAHEAMLCNTPVIGSGTGGMAELLKGGNQVICRDISELPHLVRDVIGRRKSLGKEGYRFASSFTMERFEKQWTDLIEEVVRDGPRIE